MSRCVSPYEGMRVGFISGPRTRRSFFCDSGLFLSVDNVSHLCFCHQEAQLRASLLSQLWCGLHLVSNLAFWPCFFFLRLLFPCCLGFFIHSLRYSLCLLASSEPVILKCWAPVTFGFNYSGWGLSMLVPEACRRSQHRTPSQAGVVSHCCWLFAFFLATRQET